MRILLYSASMNKIGGIETVNMNWCKRMSKYYSITFVYENGDKDRLKELSQYARVIKFDGQQFETDLCIWMSAWGKRPYQNIKATTGEYWQVVHADYEAYIEFWDFKYVKLPNITRHIAVGKHVAEAFERKTGYHADVIYNFVDDTIKSAKHKIKFIVASRIAKEKGFERLIGMCKAIKEYAERKNKDFIFWIYGDTPTVSYKDQIMEQLKDIPEVVFFGSKLDIKKELESATWCVDLSDTEGCPCTIQESLQVLTPCIVTNFKSAYEHVTDGVNGYILDIYKYDKNGMLKRDKDGKPIMNDIKWTDELLDKIFNQVPVLTEFKEKSTDQDWLDKIDELKPTLNNGLMKVKVINEYSDILLDRKVKRNEILEVTPERAKVLKDKKKVEEIYG